MANLLSIARPYALAAFDYAQEQKVLNEWNTFLRAAAIAVKQPDLLKLLNNPQVETNKLTRLLEEVLKSVLDEKKRDFLLILAQHNRLILLPEINYLFEQYLAYLEKISSVKVVTAIPVDEAFQLTLKQALTKRMKHDITLKHEVDPGILGGAIIHMGDRVIDGSIRGKLTRLLEFSLR